ncbi:hypothetical protein JR316_0005990 [Psilocybe cubensis]|uniref:Uncharacterized protein n=1 Tax=Psilocybe cubensis TaxID=181762 RepID=A0ACB8H0U4_PSICU|nr:hypothetical protein JR316_0005990 [Psilocybe cubensis]KAH9481464.1 hypothetical protein JR316_0005990 [Psilocybe cubensis]
MDNPQHYQPLSHALHPPSTSSSRPLVSHYTPNSHLGSYAQPQKPAEPTPTTGARPVAEEEEEEEEEEEDDDDEGLVEEQLNQNDDIHGSDPSSPKLTTSTEDHSATAPQSAHTIPTHDETSSPAPEQKRRPGRPRGSKNRRPRVGSAKHDSQIYHPGQSQAPTSTPSAVPQHPNISPSNQQYYEFQWRVLNLCAEFYGAAEELVKGTSPLVVAQCYHMGPSAKIDPLVMLGEAKRICDTLLANPSQLVTNPPPPMYPVITPIYQPPVVTPQATPAPSTSTPAPSTSTPTAPAPVITNPQSFVVPLGAQPGYPHPQYPVYAAGAYTTTPYYQYAAYTPGGYYPTPVPPQHMVSTPAAGTPAQPTAKITTTPATGGTVIGNQGAWSEEENERLKKLTEESRSKGPSGDIEWDWVVQEWGISRTRQILIRATALGLKESSTRATKRRRGDDQPDAPMSSLQTSNSNTSSASVPATMAMPISSPAHSTSQTGSTPAASPALQHQQRPSSSKGPSSLAPPAAAPAAPAAKLPWPMPTVAVSTPPTVIQAPSHDQQQRSSYYRPRPNQTDQAPKQPIIPPQQPASHQYTMYPSNGQGMRPKENGK